MTGLWCAPLLAAPSLLIAGGGRQEAVLSSFERTALFGVEVQEIQDAGPADEAASSGRAPCLVRLRALERPASERRLRTRGGSAPGALAGSLDTAWVREALVLSVYEKCMISGTIPVVTCMHVAVV